MAKPARDLVLGTAGHIDHGKTALVRALTGVDTDRLPEEKRRGITIDLGFAAWPIGPGLLASIVDVPGHEAFVRTMVAGAGGIDAVLLVVSAEEGVMPQTREHLLICHLLGIRHGVVALTKVDRLGDDPEAIALAEADVRTALAELAPGLAAAPVVPCSALTGAGLDALASAIRRVVAAIPPRAVKDRPILPIDRSFVVKGHGTVVTGTLLAGQLEIAADPHLTLVPAGPGRPVRELRARALHVRNSPAARVLAGTRAAVNLAAVGAAELARGDVLTRGHRVTAGDAVHALLDHLPHATRAWRSGTTVQICAGTAHTTGRLDPLGPLTGDEDAPKTMSVPPGTSALVRIRLDAPLPTWHGQRLILRGPGGDLAHGHTIGGGVVVDPRPRPGRGQRTRWLRLARALATGLTPPGTKPLTSPAEPPAKSPASPAAKGPASPAKPAAKGPAGPAKPAAKGPASPAEPAAKRSRSAADPAPKSARAAGDPATKSSARPATNSTPEPPTSATGDFAHPVRHRLAALLADAGALGIDRDELELRAGAADPEPVLSDMCDRCQAVRLGETRYVAADVLPPLAEALLAVAVRFHDEHPDRPGLSRAALLGKLPGRVAPDVAAAALDLALRRGLLELRGDVYVRGGAEPTPGISPLGLRVLDLYVKAGVAPPTLKEVQAAADLSERQALDVLVALQKSGALVRVSPDLSLAREHHTALLERVRAHLRQHSTLDVQALKALTGLSRKFVVPFLEHLDRLGITRRQGDTRVPGPKL